jgi:hypothetical protein
MLSLRGLGLYAPYVYLLILQRFAYVVARGTDLSLGQVALKDACKGMFLGEVQKLVREAPTDKDNLSSWLAFDGLPALATLRPRVHMLGELVALCLVDIGDGDHADVGRMKDFLSALADLTACRQPLSDRYAVSIVLIGSLLGPGDRLKSMCRDIAKWVNDHLEPDMVGLAGTSAKPEEEIRRALDTFTDAVFYSRRPESYLLSACLDLLLTAGLENDVLDVLEDARAVSAIPQRLIPPPDERSVQGNAGGGQLSLLHDLTQGAELGLSQIRTEHGLYQTPPTLSEQ